MHLHPARASMACRWATGKRILMMEDDVFLSEFIKHELRQLGASVLGPYATVQDGLAAIVDGAACDGAVLEIKLQDEAVYPVADALDRRGTPYVFFTAYRPNCVPVRYSHVPFCDKMESGVQIVAALFHAQGIAPLPGEGRFSAGSPSEPGL